MIVLWLEILLSEIEVRTLALSVINIVAHVAQELLALVIFISVNRSVASL